MGPGKLRRRDRKAIEQRVAALAPFIGKDGVMLDPKSDEYRREIKHLAGRLSEDELASMEEKSKTAVRSKK